MLLENKRTKDSYCKKTVANQIERGFSLVELLVVIAIISIMATFAIFALVGHKAAYGAEDQALRIINLMRDARQRAITQRQVMRFEVDFTDRVIRLIDEEAVETNAESDPHTNDVMVRQDVLSRDVNIMREPALPSGPPDGITVSPDPTVMPVSTSVSTHPLSLGHTVWAVRFRSNGTAVGAAENAGSISGTLFLWPPQPGNHNLPQNLQLVHAITFYGGTGIVRLWQFDGTAFVGK